eukprot:GHVH01005667.1.p1 GENE.GHVH01005667.1~~GHVH01005667.1.p1  ORF type:complete len:170 (+),score=33.79 GHVH01005667.1:83-592(+)
MVKSIRVPKKPVPQVRINGRNHRTNKFKNKGVSQKGSDEFKSAVNDIRNMVIPHLDSLAKRQYKQQHLIEMGLTPKRDKHNLKTFINMRESSKMKLNDVKKREKEEGIVTGLKTKHVDTHNYKMERRKEIKERKERASTKKMQSLGHGWKKDFKGMDRGKMNHKGKVKR